MNFVKGFTFAPFGGAGSLSGLRVRESLRAMQRLTGATHVILAPAGLQDTPYSESVDWSDGVSDIELLDFISYAKSLGLAVFLKPTVNCRNGVWRAHIGFFDVDVPCEPTWAKWFASYTQFQLHYAKLAQKSGCEMFLAGCEMVQTEHREAEWRAVLNAIRGEYGGLVSYNTDKYQEGHVCWWDAVDVISSSGYYPLKDWEAQLNRIEKAISPFHKPFFFAETGCMSRRGSSAVPNNWEISGPEAVAEQAAWYRAMFSACQQRPWIGGLALWDWPASLKQDSGYSVYGKLAMEIIQQGFADWGTLSGA